MFKKRKKSLLTLLILHCVEKKDFFSGMFKMVKGLYFLNTLQIHFGKVYGSFSIYYPNCDKFLKKLIAIAAPYVIIVKFNHVYKDWSGIFFDALSKYSNF